MKKANRNTRWRLLGMLAAATVALGLGALARADDTRGLRHDRERTTRARERTTQLVWLDGVLAQGRAGAWQLTDGTPLRPVTGLRWREEAGGREGSPSAGRHVRLMGQWRGGAFQVRQATLVAPQRVTERLAASGRPPEEKNPADEPH